MRWLQAHFTKHRFLFFVVLIYVTLTGVFINKFDLWRDEAFSVNVAQMPVMEMISTVGRDVHPPLHLFLLKGWMTIFGDTAVAVRSLSVMFGVLTIILSYKVIEILFKENKSKQLTLLLVATAPFILFYGIEGRVYTMLMASTVGIVLTTLQILQTPQPQLQRLNFGFITAILSGLYGHVIFLFAIPAIIIWQLLLIRQKAGSTASSFKKARPYMAQFFKNYLVSGILFLPWLTALFYQIRQVNTQGFWLSFNPIVDLVTSFGQFFVSNKVSQDVGLLSPLIIFLTITFGFSFYSIAAYFSRRNKFLPLLTPLVLAAVFLASFHTPIYFIRYLTFLTPLVSIGVGLGIVATTPLLGRKTTFILAVLLISMQLYLFGGNSMQLSGVKAEYRQAISYIANEYPSAQILHPHGYTLHSFIYYSKQTNLSPGKLYDPDRSNPHFEGLAAFSDENYFDNNLGEATFLATPYLGRNEGFEQILREAGYRQIESQLFDGGLTVAIWAETSF